MWTHSNDIPVAEKMSNSFAANHANANSIDIGAICGLKVLTIDQWLYGGVTPVEYDRVNAEVSFGDKGITGIICDRDEDAVIVKPETSTR